LALTAAVTFFVVFAVVVVATLCALLAAWLLLVGDVQPVTNKDAKTRKRTSITAIGLNCIRLYKWCFRIFSHFR